MKMDDSLLQEYVELQNDETDDYDEDNEALIPDELSDELADEREQMLEADLYHDEHPIDYTEPNDDEAEPIVLRREMLKTAIGRIERAARTQEEFENITVCWDKLEQNEARRLRNHELSRGDIPLEFGKTMDGAIFPGDYTQPRWRQILHGNFFEVIHDCPFELDELPTDVTISHTMRELRDEHKVIFYWHYIRQLSCVEIGRMRGQTDRNIRKTRAVLIRKIHKRLLKAWQLSMQSGGNLTDRQQAFVEKMD